MRLVTVVVFGAIIILLGGAAVWGFTATSNTVGLSERWISDTHVPLEVNHHAPGAGAVGAEGMVFAPISGEADTDQCALVALNSATGKEQWRYSIPPVNCTIHAVADPTIADLDGDGTPEVFAATTENAVIGMTAATGAVQFRSNLTAYGYTQPAVIDFTDHSGLEVVVVDVMGSVFVLDADGEPIWRDRRDAYTWGQPAVADFDGDGSLELIVGSGNGDLVLYNQDGGIEWTRKFDGAITWLAVGPVNDRTGIAVATTNGVTELVDGRDGSTQWRHDFGAFAAVRAFGDGDGDGTTEVYAVARDGILRAITAADGTIEWTTALTTADVQMTPPPTLGDVTGDGSLELVGVTNDGVVSLVDPTTGEVVDTYRREVAIWTHPTLADTDADGIDEIYVIYGDGRVVALSAHQ